MKRITARIAVLAAGLAVPAAVATSALADGGPGVPQTQFAPQTATQTNTNTQTATCSAKSDQSAPSWNSEEAQQSKDSKFGDVTQAPQSNPTCNATNNNTTTQTIAQQQQKKQEEEQQQPQKEEQQDPSAG